MVRRFDPPCRSDYDTEEEYLEEFYYYDMECQQMEDYRVEETL